MQSRPVSILDSHRLIPCMTAGPEVRSIRFMGALCEKQLKTTTAATNSGAPCNPSYRSLDACVHLQIHGASRGLHPHPIHQIDCGTSLQSCSRPCGRFDSTLLYHEPRSRVDWIGLEGVFLAEQGRKVPRFTPRVPLLPWRQAALSQPPHQQPRKTRGQHAVSGIHGLVHDKRAKLAWDGT